MIIPSTTADASAPPPPCRKRAAISIPWLCESAHRSDAPVKTARPVRKMRRWPSRSPRRPASSSRPPNAIRDALTVQARLVCEKPRSSLIDGSATFTTVPSSTIISTAAHSTYSASQRLRSVLISAAAVTSPSPSRRIGVRRSRKSYHMVGKSNLAVGNPDERGTLSDMGAKRTYGDACGIARALDVVGERWALMVVRELLLGPKRFTDLRTGLPHVSSDVLAQPLRDLERTGVVQHRRLPPPSAVQG